MSDTLILYTVYDSPADYPFDFVVRRWNVRPPEAPVPDPEPYIIGPSLEHVREKLRTAGLVNLNRFPDDDPVIVETWI